MLSWSDFDGDPDREDLAFLLSGLLLFSFLFFFLKTTVAICKHKVWSGCTCGWFNNRVVAVLRWDGDATVCLPAEDDCRSRSNADKSQAAVAATTQWTDQVRLFCAVMVLHHTHTPQTSTGDTPDNIRPQELSAAAAAAAEGDEINTG